MGVINVVAPFFFAGSLRLRMLEMEKLVNPLDPVVALFPLLLALLSLLLAPTDAAAATAAAAAEAHVLLWFNVLLLLLFKL